MITTHHNNRESIFEAFFPLQVTTDQAMFIFLKSNIRYQVLCTKFVVLGHSPGV